MKIAHRLLVKRDGWDYRCCGLEAQEVRLMTDEEYRSVRRPALLWLAVFVFCIVVFYAPKPDSPLLMAILNSMRVACVFLSILSFWLAAILGRCAFHRTVMVFHGKPIVKDQFKLAGYPCQSPLKLSKEPVTIRVFWPVCLVLVDSDLWEPHPWFRRWPHSVKLVAMARGETQFSGSREMNVRERKELAKHALGALLRVVMGAFGVLAFGGMLGKSFEMFGDHEITNFVNEYGIHLFWIAIACQFLWVYRALLMLLDCLWGSVYRHPGSEFSWLCISRSLWHRDGKPAKWREHADFMHYPPRALSRYARENLSYHKRGIGDEMPA